MFHGVKVLDVHSHLHDVTMTDRRLKPHLGRPFWTTLTSIPGRGARGPLPSPIGPGKHSDEPGNRDEDFQHVAGVLARYLDTRNIDVQIISPHPLEFHGCMEHEDHFLAWNRSHNDRALKLPHAAPA